LQRARNIAGNWGACSSCKQQLGAMALLRLSMAASWCECLQHNNSLTSKLTNALPPLLPPSCTRSLSFYALQLMSAHVYTLLGDLRVITTGLLNYLVLDKQLNRQAVLSLCMLFCGISIGQAATMDSAGDSQHTGDSSSTQHWVTGVALMLLISSLSAVASVYQEWVMSHAARYKHESINLQNVRLYVVGVLLNGVWYLQSGGASQPFLADMRPSHWAVALILACMGLVTVSSRAGTCGLHAQHQSVQACAHGLQQPSPAAL
jgi:drug/metabolite transporter (DMT)-like permease